MRNRDQERGIGEPGADAMDHLLRSALPPVSDHPELHRDLWPAMLRRFDEESLPRVSRVPWFDWALAAGLVALAAMAPHTIPVILYYL
jgi:hypothetical protein